MKTSPAPSCAASTTSRLPGARSTRCHGTANASAARRTRAAVRSRDGVRVAMPPTVDRPASCDQGSLSLPAGSRRCLRTITSARRAGTMCAVPMNLERKLARWQEAGLIDAATRARIEAHEQSERKPVVPYALAVLGAGTLALGILSVVAANWDAIPGRVKVGSDLAPGAVLAVATYRAVSQGRRLATEVLVTLFYGFTLASLALVGQVYQLTAPTYQALLVWSASTLPLVLLGQSRFLAALVTAGLALTHVTAVAALFEHVSESVAISEDTERNLVAAVSFASALVYVPLSRVPWLLRNRPEYARTLGSIAWTFVLVAGFAAQFL